MFLSSNSQAAFSLASITFSTFGINFVNYVFLSILYNGSLPNFINLLSSVPLRKTVPTPNLLSNLLIFSEILP